MSSLIQAFDLWGVPHVEASEESQKLCKSRFDVFSSLSETLKCLPIAFSTLTKNDYHRCWLWNEDFIAEVLADRTTNRYLPVGSLGDGSWLAIDCESKIRNSGVGIFPIDDCGDDDWQILSPELFRDLGMTWGDYLETIFHTPLLDLLNGYPDR